MKVDKLTLERVFERTERLEAPLFQRPYVWKAEPNWEPLWAAIQTVAERRLEGKTLRPHFLGTIVLDQLRTGTGRIHVRQLIDGQQRLTTLQLALAAIRDLCLRVNEGRYAKAIQKLTENDVPLSDEPDDVFKVWPTNADRADFRSVMRAGSATSVRKMEHANPDDEWLVPNAYLYFHDTIDEWLGPAGSEAFQARLDSLYMTIRDDLQFVVIDLEAQDDAQEIFETLNALGTPLLPADLVKNYLFHRASVQQEDIAKLYGLYWASFDDARGYWRKEIRQGRLKRPRLDCFLYHYLRLMLRDELSIAQLFSAYRELVEEGVDDSAAKHMEDFRAYADVYKRFEEFDAASPEGLFFYRLDELDTTTVFPLLLEVVKRFGRPGAASELRQILGDLESFFVRRTVCELTPKGYNRLVVDMLKELQRNEDWSASAIRTFLLRQDADTARWPSDEEFKTSWMRVDFYRRLKRARARMILEALETALHGGKTEKIQLERRLTIEHLLPREWEEHWPLPGGVDIEKYSEQRAEALHKIGNLTLLTKELNPSISNGGWDRKRKEILKHSALNLNRDLPGEWNEQSIERRSEVLFKLALRVWPRP